LPAHADVALALWTLHTWAFDAFDITPYLAITSPTRRCGKTVLMTLLFWLTRRGKKNDSMSQASIYRSVDKDQPTLVLDEVSWVVDLRDDRQGILCGGFECNGYAETCEGEGANITTRLWATFCPKAFGLIGSLTPTLTDRAISIPMKRKLPGDGVERYSRRDCDEYAHIRRQALRWAADNLEALKKESRPGLLHGLNDRAGEMCEPLFAIADLAGGPWSELARKAAIALSADGLANDDSINVQALADARTVFERRKCDSVFSKDLTAAMADMVDRPWGSWGKSGKPITPNALSKLLAFFEIRPRDIRIGYENTSGYRLKDFEDPCRRYLPGAQSSKREARQEPSPRQEQVSEVRHSDTPRAASDSAGNRNSDRGDLSDFQNPLSRASTKRCRSVGVENAGSAAGESESDETEVVRVRF
jgi:hypothetical protein